MDLLYYFMGFYIHLIHRLRTVILVIFLSIFLEANVFIYGVLGSILSTNVLHYKMIFFIGTQFFHWVPNVVFCKCPFSWANSFREGVTVS